MTNKYSAGPWEVFAIFPAIHQTFTPRVWIQAKCAYYDNQTIRIADIPDVLSRDSEEMANAHLMAAAPELLEALTELFNLQPTQESSCNPVYWSAVQRARSAIKKATA